MKKINFTLQNQWEKVIILGHSNELNEGELTLDAEIRLRAGYYLLSSKKVNKIILLGGGNDKIPIIPESEIMRKYLIEECKITKDHISIDNMGTNTLENIVNLIKKFCNQDFNNYVFLTSDYNVGRLKLILELLGKSTSFVLSAEKVLLETEDKLKDTIKEYFYSLESQNRILYENYWFAKTIFDEKYTKKARQELNIKISPQEYFQNQSRKLMENLEEK